ncbi:hypothetical protein LCGC14_0814630 [marine sediment metagenome]|uniref:Uncharacterized protein n=1 Tax=marine sediment metagenome TaxID=412755 RepID=A0A0F9Q5Y5_9ZZZZ
MTTTPDTDARCSCHAGTLCPCNGPAASHRRAPKHGGRLVTAQPDHVEHGPDSTHAYTDAHDAVDRQWVTGGEASSFVRHGQHTETPVGGHALVTTVAQWQPRSSTLDAHAWAERQQNPTLPACRVAIAARAARAARAASLETTTVPAPTTRSSHAGLNGTTRGAAAHAVDVRETIHQGQATVADTPRLTRRQRRALASTAHRAGGATGK